jgi:DNA repair protein RecO (recombination protein O)
VISAEPIARDHAIVLRWYPVTDTSRVVVWFTRHHGRLSTLIKGALRPKSFVLGQYDLFHTCELLFYTRSSDDLHIFRECSPLRRRSPLRHDWRACAAASFVADLLHRASPPLAAAEALFDLASLCLDQLASGHASPALLFWYELRLLHELGLAPDLGDSPLANAIFDHRDGRIIPPGTPPSAHASPISGGALAILRHLVDTSAPADLRRLRLSPGQIREIAGHLDLFATWHLDLRLPSRALALDLLTRPAAA